MTKRNQLAQAFIRGIEAGAEEPQLAGDGDAMYQRFRDYMAGGGPDAQGTEGRALASFTPEGEIRSDDPARQPIAVWPCEFTCMGCGCKGRGEHNRQGEWFKPRDWFSRVDDDGVQIACSHKCIDTIAGRTGKTAVCLPI